MIGKHFSTLGALGIAALFAGLFVACEDGPAPVTPEAPAFARGPAGSTSAQVNKQLAELRQATVRFKDFDQALAEDYDFLFMDMCMVDTSPEQRGGMGYHYVNLGLLDAEVSVSEPEALLYEALPNGRLRLTGVEYVIPKDAWPHDHPPELLGQKFTLNSFDLWALHVWVWKNNPSGMFADWNPNVTCD